MSVIALQVQRTVSAGSVLVGENVIFDTSVTTTDGINYDSNLGIISLTEEGLYYIDWFVTVGLGAVPIFAIKTSKGDYIRGNSPFRPSVVMGSGLIEVDTTGVDVSLVNDATETISYMTGVPIAANLLIHKIDADSLTEGDPLVNVADTKDNSVSLPYGSDLVFGTNTPHMVDVTVSEGSAVVTIDVDGATIQSYDPENASNYLTGLLIQYEGNFYIVTTDNPTGAPDTSPDYELFGVAGGVTGMTGTTGGTGATAPIIYGQH